MAAFTPSFGDRLVERYEELRRQAAGELGRGAGMVVFLRQGMKAWMDSWSKWASEPTERPSNRSDSGNVLPPKARDEITLVLAGMALRGNALRYPETDAQGAIQGVGAITA